jgi:hypothetical protein
LWEEVPSALQFSPILFVLLFILIVALFSRGCDKSTQIQNLTNDKQFLQSSFTTTGQSNASLIGNYQLEVQRLNETTREKDNRIFQISQERDKAQVEALEAQHSLAQWMLLANSSTTNTPLVNSLKTLSDALTSSSRAMDLYNQLASNSPNFHVSVNGTEITNNFMSIVLGTNRQIYIRPITKGHMTAVHPVISFLVPDSLDASNIVAGKDWVLKPLKARNEGQMFNTWEIRADESMPYNTEFHASALTLSTNVQYPFIQTAIEVFSDTSFKQHFTITILLNQ